MGKNSVTMEKKMSAAEVVSFLESIIASLKEGKIVIQQERQLAVLKPEKLITVEVEAGQKDDKGKLSIDLEWKKPEKIQPEADILVSSIEPEPVPVPETDSDHQPEPKKEIEVKTSKTSKKQKPEKKNKVKSKTKK